MENKTKTKLGLVAVLVVVALTVLALWPIQQQQEYKRTWHTQYLNALGDFDPGAGAGGFQRIVIKALPDGSSINPATNASMAVNLTDIDADGTSRELPHSTKFGIYIYARFNATQAYSVGNTTWVDAWTRCNITGANLSIGPCFMNRTQVDIAGTVYVYECFYLEVNSTGKPLMLARDQWLDLTSITLEAYY